MAGRVARRLAAILAADVVGYSRLMEVDEEGTHNRLKAHRTEIIEPTVARYQGRIVKLTGDGALVEFASVVDAVRCACEVQHGMAARNRDLPDNERMVFRIGINLGDVIDDDEDVYGDGVNIAVRLESLATDGGICIADVAYELVRFGNDIEFKDLGLQRLKNIGRSIRVWAWPPEAIGHARTTKASVNALPLPNKPSIAILPFANLGDDENDERFCEGLVDDLITEVSRLSGLLVIARNSVSRDCQKFRVWAMTMRAEETSHGTTKEACYR